MKNSLLLVFIMAIATQLSGQVCVIDPTLTEPGIYPPGSNQSDSVITMPNGMVGAFYDEVAQIVVPLDTNVVFAGSTFSATIDSIHILQLLNIPSSISYACNTSNCTWNGGDNGCVQLTGTPQPGENGLHHVTVQCLGWASVGVFGQISDTINFYMDLLVMNSIGLEENAVLNSYVYPEPIRGKGQFKFTSFSEEVYTMEISNVHGTVLQRFDGLSVIGEQVIEIDLSDQPSGIYFYSFSLDQRITTGKIMKED